MLLPSYISRHNLLIINYLTDLLIYHYTFSKNDAPIGICKCTYYTPTFTYMIANTHKTLIIRHIILLK